MNRDESEGWHMHRRGSKDGQHPAAFPNEVWRDAYCQDPATATPVHVFTPAALAARDRVVAATAAETALRDAADEADDMAGSRLNFGEGDVWVHSEGQVVEWLMGRADALAAAAHPDEKYQP